MTESRSAGRVARGGAWLFVVTLIASGAAFLTSMFLARALGPVVFGPYSTAYFFTLCLGVVAAAGFPVVLTREVATLRARGDAAAATARYREAEAAARRLSGACVIAILALSVAALASGSEGLAGLATSALVLSGAILPLATGAVRRADLTGREAYRDIALSTVLAAPLGLLLSVIAVSCGLGVAGAGGAAVLGTLLLSLLLGAARARRAESDPPPPRLAPANPEFRRSARRCLAIQAIDLLVWQRSELIFLALLLPKSPEAGYYGAAFSLAVAAMALVPGALAGALLPAVTAIHVAARPGGPELQRAYVRSLRALAVLALPILAGGLVLARPLVATALGADYADTSTEPFQILLVGGAVGALGAASSTILYATGGEGFILKTGLALAVVNVALDLAFIPGSGAVGAAIANTTTQLLAVGFGTLWVARRVVRAFPGPLAIARVAGATLGMTALLVALGEPGPGFVALAARIALGAAAYGVLVFLMGALDPADKALAREIFRKTLARRPSRRTTPRVEEGAPRERTSRVRGPRSDPPVGMPT